MDTLTLFAEAISWLRQNYATWRFYVERDVVWTVQERIRAEAERQNLGLRIFNDFGMGNRRNTDVVMMDAGGEILLAVEFKYEPSHRRSDIPETKFPVVSWGMEGVEQDVARVNQFVSEGRAAQAVAIFVDEGRYFRDRQPHEGSHWEDWDDHPEYGPASVLWTEVP